MSIFKNVITIIDDNNIKNFKLNRNRNGIVIGIHEGVKLKTTTTIYQKCEYCGQDKYNIKYDCCGASS